MTNRGQYNFRKPIDRAKPEYQKMDLDLETVQRPALDKLNREIQYKGSTKKLMKFMLCYMAFIGLVIYVIYMIRK